jgi:hypothetical protein
MKLTVLLAVFAATLAAIDGTVVNQTTGQPQPGATVSLFRLGQGGMESLETVKTNDQGKFAFQKDEQGAALIQAVHQGVTYSHMLQPGAARTGLTVSVYSAAAKADAKVTQHMMLFEPTGDSVMVSETYILNNTGKTTWSDPQSGTLRIYLPPAAKGIVQVNATAPQGMPIRRVAEKTAEANVYKIDFPIKPGESRIDLTYLAPAGAPFDGRILFTGDGATRLVAPAGVELKGAGIEALGQEPRTQATIYSVKSKQFKIEIAGTGTLRQPEAESAGSEGPRIEQVMPRLYQSIDSDAGTGAKLASVKWVLALSLAVLTLGFVLLYRAGSAPAHAQSDRARR